MNHRPWIKLWCEGILDGSINQEPIEVRFLWIALLCLAGETDGENGIIQFGDGVGLPDEVLAKRLKVNLADFRKAKSRLQETERIAVSESNVITILNWKKYQANYVKLRRYRETSSGPQRKCSAFSLGTSWESLSNDTASNEISNEITSNEISNDTPGSGISNEITSGDISNETQRKRIEEEKEKKENKNLKNIRASPKGEAQTGKAPKENVPHFPWDPKNGLRSPPPQIPEAVKVYRKAFFRYPAKNLYSLIAENVGSSEEDLRLFFQACQSWSAHGWNPRNIAGLLEYFKNRAFLDPSTIPKASIPKVGKVAAGYLALAEKYEKEERENGNGKKRENEQKEDDGFHLSERCAFSALLDSS